MRTIKFRGKSVDPYCRGEWIYGSLTTHNMGYDYIVAEESHECIDIDPATVGQFTGLQDADGRDIYEGDIVRLELNGELYKVVWYNGIVGFTLEWNDILYPFIPDNKLVIVGNIHDNPELLEGDQK